MRYVISVMLLLACSAAPVLAADTSVTIYSKTLPGALSPEYFRPGGGWISSAVPGYAMVRQQRDVKLEKERGQVKFTDVASLIDPTTVTFKSLTDPDNTTVLEQDYQFDLVSPQKLLERYLDQEITVEQTRGDSIESVTGKLLSPSMTLQTKDGKVVTLNGYSVIKFPELPGGLLTKPTLVWDIAAKKTGAHKVEVSYQTEGITWWADYNATFTEGKDANSGLLDLGAWVSIVNRSGAGYEDAALKLVAGDVQRVQGQGTPRPVTNAIAYESDSFSREKAGFQEKSFFEYHLYTLGRTATIPDNATKQIELFPQAQKIPVKKLMVYDGAGGYGYYGGLQTSQDFGVPSNKKVNVYLQFKNEKENHLGIPLPSGRMRVNKKDEADGALEFIGEDVIDHTPKDEEIRIKLGEAFDVVGERRQTDFKLDNARQYMDESFEIKLRNHKDSDVEVLVMERLYRGHNWEIIDKSTGYDKLDTQTVHFPVTVKKDGEKVIRYTVRYTW